MHIGCMSGIALLPFIAAGMVIGAVTIWMFPWLLIPVLVWRLVIALKGR